MSLCVIVIPGAFPGYAKSSRYQLTPELASAPSGNTLQVQMHIDLHDTMITLIVKHVIREL